MVASRADSILLAVVTIPLLVVAIGALFVVPRFGAMFRSFGAQLPFETVLLLATYRFWLLVPLAFAVAAFVWPTPLRKAPIFIPASAVLAFVLFAAGLWACYSPVFRLAESV
jgi:type II secretory pathway component PulF